MVLTSAVHLKHCPANPAAVLNDGQLNLFRLCSLFYDGRAVLQTSVISQVNALQS